MRRRLLLVLLVSVVRLRAADPARDSASVITGLAASLTAGNVQEFMAPFDPAMPGLDRLRAGVAALATQGETQSFIELTKNEGDEHARTLELTWELRILRTGDATISSRREVTVTCKLELRGKRWRIIAFQPIDFLIP
jgi:hypothetical protein